MKIKLKNVSQVPVDGQLPGAGFRVDAIDEATPKRRFWRKMLANKDGIILVPGEQNKPQKKETLTLKTNENVSSKKPQVKKEEAA